MKKMQEFIFDEKNLKSLLNDNDDDQLNIDQIRSVFAEFYDLSDEVIMGID
jgi:hypothetical protein